MQLVAAACGLYIGGTYFLSHWVKGALCNIILLLFSLHWNKPPPCTSSGVMSMNPLVGKLGYDINNLTVTYEQVIWSSASVKLSCLSWSCVGIKRPAAPKQEETICRWTAHTGGAVGPLSAVKIRSPLALGGAKSSLPAGLRGWISPVDSFRPPRDKLRRFQTRSDIGGFTEMTKRLPLVRRL